MANYTQQIKDDLGSLWKNLGFFQKSLVLLLVVVLAVAITYILVKSGEPDWAVLYSDLGETDAAAVASNLKEAGVPYKLSADSKSILVVRDKVDELRLSIAEEDVIKENYGFGDLEKIPLGSTKDMQNLYWLRMIQGELTKTIKTIKGIKNARVSIAMPERSIFTSEDEQPKASITLILEPGFRVDADKVKAIKNLVANAVPRLMPDNVFILDHKGEPLSDELGDTSSNLAMTDLKTKTEKTLSDKVQSVLEKIAGKNNVEVATTVVMNFDKVESQYDRVIPINTEEGNAKGILVSSQTNVEKYDGKNGQNVGGVPGSASNVPSFQGDSPGGQNNTSQYQKENAVNNYEFSKEKRYVNYAPGTIEKITVAVAINKILTSAEKDEIKNLTVSAAGIDEDRGDIVTITGMPFSVDEGVKKQEDILNEMNSKANWDLWVKDIAPIAVVLVLGLTTLFMFYTLIKKPLVAEELDDEGYDDEEYEAPTMPELLEAATIPLVDAKLDPEIERMRTDIASFISSNPEEASRILLAYMKD